MAELGVAARVGMKGCRALMAVEDKETRRDEDLLSTRIARDRE